MAITVEQVNELKVGSVVVWQTSAEGPVAFLKGIGLDEAGEEDTFWIAPNQGTFFLDVFENDGNLDDVTVLFEAASFTEAEGTEVTA